MSAPRGACSASLLQRLPGPTKRSQSAGEIHVLLFALVRRALTNVIYTRRRLLSGFALTVGSRLSSGR